MNMSATQRKVFTVISLMAFMLAPAFSTLASEREANSVELTIYQMTESEWGSSLSAFQTAVASETVTYCTANYEVCGLASSSTIVFVSSQVGVSSGPKEESKSLKVSIYIDFDVGPFTIPHANSSTQHVVSITAVRAILEGSMSTLETVLDHDITYIGDVFYSVEPDEKMNKILIPIAFIVLFAIIFLAIGLHVWKKRQEQEERKKLKSEKRSKKTGRVRPLHGVEDETHNKQASNFWPRRFRKKKTVQVRMESLYEEQRQPRRNNNGHVPTLSLKTSMTVSDPKNTVTNEKLHYEERVLARNDTLPPLPSLDQKGTSEDEREREKREKKERRRRRKEKRHQEKQENGAESESEKSKSESLSQNVVPVEA